MTYKIYTENAAHLIDAPTLFDALTIFQQISDAEVIGITNVDKFKEETEEEYEPYFGWCDVSGCENEGCSGGNAWKNTGYWTVCHKHSQEFRDGKPQPQMKQSAIDREKTRGADGVLINPPPKLTSQKG